MTQYLSVGVGVHRNRGKDDHAIFLNDLQSWIVKNYPAIWAEWLMIGPYCMDFDNWIAEEHYDKYCTYEKHLGQALK